MLKIIVFTLVMLLSFNITVSANEQNETKPYLVYKKYFLKKVYAFANKNRFNLKNINRDKYTNCYLIVGIETTILENGTVKNISIKKPSLVKKVDKYFNYIIKSAEPYEYLEKHYGQKIESIVLFNYFRLNLNMYEKSKITQPCS